jgi:zinc and cadmium transporter
MNTWLYALLSVSLISAASLTAVFTFYLSTRNLDRLMFVLVSIATGAMLGNALVHLVPESFEYAESGAVTALTVSLFMLGGYLLSFFFHKVLHLQCHHADSNCDVDESPHLPRVKKAPIHITGHMSILSHGNDNFTDGMLIGIAYLNSIEIGIATTIAIILHEIPMELGGFGILVNAGYSKRTAVVINFLSGLIAVAGTLAVLVLGGLFKWLPSILTPVGAGMVIYLVASGLIPMAQKESSTKRVLTQTAFMLVGIAIMIACKLLG